MDRRVESALTDLDRERPDVAAVARETWDALTGGSGDAREVSQWWLQMFCWDLLARDVDSTPEQRWAAASALGDLLERIGLRRYAEIARGDATRAILLASDSPDAYAAAYAAALRESGIQPPDTPLLTWGSVMGPAEADTYERVAHALELSLVSGDVVLGRRGTAGVREKVTEAVLTSPYRGMGGERPLHRICAERLKRWSAGSPALQALLAPLAGDLTSGIPVPVPPAPAALRPLQGLLRALREPVALTSAGYLPPAAVAAVRARAGMGRAGTARREADVPEVRALRDVAQRLGLVRVSRRAVVLTPRGRAGVDDAPGLAGGVAAGWFPPRRTAPVVAREVVTALLAGGSRPTRQDAGAQVREVLTQEGWRLGKDEVPAAVAAELAAGTYADLVSAGMARAPGAGERWEVAEPALPVLTAALRHHLLHHALRQTQDGGPEGR